MQLQQDFDAGRFMIRGYGPGWVDVGDRRFERSLIVEPVGVRDWPPAGLDELEDAHLAAILENDPEVVLLGTGETMRHPPMWVIGYFAERGMGVEFMATPAACRTYNVICAEGRRVAAALIVD